LKKVKRLKQNRNIIFYLYKYVNMDFHFSYNKDNKSATNSLVCHKNFINTIIYLAKWKIFAQREISFDLVRLKERGSILLYFFRRKYLIGNRKSSKEIFTMKVDKTQYASIYLSQCQFRRHILWCWDPLERYESYAFLISNMFSCSQKRPGPLTAPFFLSFFLNFYRTFE